MVVTDVDEEALYILPPWESDFSSKKRMSPSQEGTRVRSLVRGGGLVCPRWVNDVLPTVVRRLQPGRHLLREEIMFPAIVRDSAHNLLCLRYVCSHSSDRLSCVCFVLFPFLVSSVPFGDIVLFVGN